MAETEGVAAFPKIVNLASVVLVAGMVYSLPVAVPSS
jgi:hypothetical protein